MSRLPNLSNIQVMIAIVTYNGENYIKDCLNSIVTKSNCQIHVLDNNSTDRTTTIVEKEFPNVHLTRSLLV
ncbi:MAG: glycosyltransferase, partial [Bacteroidia bacterium]|nr:glycosyltransferase [Bacteroidia bacterium]